LPHNNVGFSLESKYFRAMAAASTPLNMASQILRQTLGYMGPGAATLTFKEAKGINKCYANWCVRKLKANTVM